MQLKTIAGLVLAALLVTGSAAALPGNAPAQADDHANDSAADADVNDPDVDDNDSATADENASDAADSEAAESESEMKRGPPEGVPAADDGQRGPPADMPEQVPDFVSEIHSLVQQQIDGDLAGSLGEQISDLTPDDSEDTDSEDADGTDA